MATFILASVPGTQYVISVTGQSNQSNSFIQFFIDPDGDGADFVQLGSNINFGSGFETITLPAFTDLGTSDFLRLMNGGTGNGEIQISNITVDSPGSSRTYCWRGLPWPFHGLRPSSVSATASFPIRDRINQFSAHRATRPRLLPSGVLFFGVPIGASATRISGPALLAL